MRKLAILSTACLIIASGLGQGHPAADQMVNLGTHRLQAEVQGTGAPPVVIDAGIGEGLSQLRELQKRIAEVTQVITYNRAGYGQSEPGPLPRDSGREATELRDLLEKMSLPGPYLLVGHSLGALNMQAFASKYPDDVAGMVLMDPPPLSFIQKQEYYEDLGAMAEQLTEKWQQTADAAANSSDAQERAKGILFRMMASEHREMFGKSADLAGAISTFGDIPFVVMAAGKANPAVGEVAKEFQEFWIEQNRLLSQKSSAGRFILAEESSHHLYRDVLDLAVETILSMVDGLREK